MLKPDDLIQQLTSKWEFAKRHLKQTYKRIEAWSTAWSVVILTSLAFIVVTCGLAAAAFIGGYVWPGHLGRLTSLGPLYPELSGALIAVLGTTFAIGVGAFTVIFHSAKSRYPGSLAIETLLRSRYVGYLVFQVLGLLVIFVLVITHGSAESPGDIPALFSVSIFLVVIGGLLPMTATSITYATSLDLIRDHLDDLEMIDLIRHSMDHGMIVSIGGVGLENKDLERLIQACLKGVREDDLYLVAAILGGFLRKMEDIGSKIEGYPPPHGTYFGSMEAIGDILRAFEILVLRVTDEAIQQRDHRTVKAVIGVLSTLEMVHTRLEAEDERFGIESHVNRIQAAFLRHLEEDQMSELGSLAEHRFGLFTESLAEEG